MPKREAEDEEIFNTNTANLDHPQRSMQALDIEALIGKPPVPFEPGFRVAGQGSDVVSFRVPRPVAADWRQWCNLVQALLVIPDGVLPQIALEFLQNNREQLIRRYQDWESKNS